MNEKIVTSNWSTETKELYEQLQKLYKRTRELLQDPDIDCQKAYFRIINSIRLAKIRESLEYYLNDEHTEHYDEVFILSAIMTLHPEKSNLEILNMVENI